MKIRLIASAMVLLGVFAAFQIIGSEGEAGVIGSSLKFFARMSGDQEVPAVDTSAQGVAEFVLRNDAEIHYRVRISAIKNPTAAHIHVGTRGANGPVAVALAGFVPPPVSDANTFIDIEFSGVLTSADLQGDLRGSSLQELYKLMAARKTYINVHTTQNPTGEIRGQILSTIGIGG